MTPLAHFITKQLTLPLKRRRFKDDGSLLINMGDIHCFECTDIIGAARDLLEESKKQSPDQFKVKISEMISQTSFLPAPKTWIEYQEENLRLGFLLIANKENKFATVLHAFGGDNKGGDKVAASMRGSIRMPLVDGEGENDVCRFDMPDMEEIQLVHWVMELTVILAFINTPRIIGRRQHMPHCGLERHLLAQRGVIGKFPLNAWTEIKLDITGPKDVSDKASVEAHYTGERALHFCRSHLRIRLGHLEIVRAHWRGDASLGIRQSRYKMVAA